MNDQSSAYQPDIEALYPEVGSCYGHAWHTMWKKFVDLFLIILASFALSIPAWGLSYYKDIPWPIHIIISGFSFIYAVFFYWPLEYGISYAFLRAARGEAVRVSDMFEVFKNYLNALLANIIVGLVIIIGLCFCIVPGIILACKLAFVPYLIVDRKMEVTDAIRDSWNMTTGHAVTVFLIGFLAVPIFIAGFIVCCVGMVVSSIWVKLAFAYIYFAVARTMMPPADQSGMPATGERATTP